MESVPIDSHVNMSSNRTRHVLIRGKGRPTEFQWLAVLSLSQTVKLHYYGVKGKTPRLEDEVEYAEIVFVQAQIGFFWR